MTGDGTDPLILSLRRIFSQAAIHVSLAGLTEAEQKRDITFYDETLLVAVRLRIPASDKTLPYPATSDSSKTSFALPLEPQLEPVDEDEESNTSSPESPPVLLVLLLAALQVSLDASYTAPRLSSSPASRLPANELSEISSSSNYVVPSTSKRDAAYQNVPLQQTSNTGEATRMFQSTWKGNSLPHIPRNGSDDDDDNECAADDLHDHARNGGEISYVESKGVGVWITEWRCKMPVVFVRTRHPTPALMLTALLTLRLQQSQVARLAPSLIASHDTTSASESLFLHDLLNPLSEGPSYPDESPAERAARANASLAKLPLGRLPSAILGSKLVTPARNAKEVGLLTERKGAIDNGDVGDASGSGKRGGRRVLTNEGLLAFQLGSEGGLSALSNEQVKGLGEDINVLQRSARTVLDVQSAIMVRMRTTTVTDFHCEDEEMSNSSLMPALILCVEVENPINSGMRYAMDSVEVAVSTPSGDVAKCADTSQSGYTIDVHMRSIGKVEEPLVIEQGSQINLLYRANFDAFPQGEDNYDSVLRALNSSVRNVSIKLLGRPVLMVKQGDEVTTHTPTKKFVSTWTCTLDLAQQMKMVALNTVTQQGAGLHSFRETAGKRRQEAPMKRSVSASTLVVNTAAAHEPSFRSPSPYTPHPRTPTEQRIASSTPHSYNIEPARSPSRSFSLRPPLRLTSSASEERFISVQKSNSDSMDATSPALPSALAGQSILARVRMSRNREESRQLVTGGSPTPDSGSGWRNTSDTTATPRQRQYSAGFPSSSQQQQSNAGDATMHEVDAAMKDALLPLSDKRSGAVAHRLLYSPINEQGLLIDVIACSTAREEGPPQEGEKGRIRARVEVQVENRSESERTILLSWKRSNIEASSSLAFDAILFDDDDVQVGPLARQDSDLVSLTLYFRKPGQHTLPPLVVYEVSSGVERVLQGMHPIVV